MARTSANIDEDALRDMVKGDIPRLSKPNENQPPQKEHGAEPEIEENPEPMESLAVESPKPRRRKEPKDYASVYLRKREPVQKRQTYISSALFTKITKILAVVASDLTVPTFLDNLIENHLEQYRDEINALYNNNFETPL